LTEGKATTSSAALSAAGFDRMRRFATLLFVLVTLLYLVVRIATDSLGLWGYVRAFAEAAMVGALADWFAVTALFRRPLGLPIPHTAIIAERKNEIGRGLGEFVQTNFLTPGVLAARVHDAAPASRLGVWLESPENVAIATDGVARAINVGAGLLRDDDVQRLLESTIRARLETVPAAPVLGRLLDTVRDNGRQAQLVSAILERLADGLQTNREVLRSRFATESPWWVPDPLDDKVFTRLFDGFTRLLNDLRRDPTHQLRREIDRRIDQFVLDLQNDPKLLARGEQTKAELLEHPAVREWIASAWTDVKTSLLAQTRDPSSALQQRIGVAVEEFGARLRTDPELRTRIDGFVERSVVRIVESSGQEVADLITSTVERWDTDETVERIESQIGRDLQFIRINGTIVGGLAGLVIHVVGQVIG
jgi:uncharacterized membrane-anchored protein YjiN (DUF445 family)